MLNSANFHLPTELSVGIQLRDKPASIFCALPRCPHASFNVDVNASRSPIPPLGPNAEQEFDAVPMSSTAAWTSDVSARSGLGNVAPSRWPALFSWPQAAFTPSISWAFIASDSACTAFCRSWSGAWVADAQLPDAFACGGGLG